jgi:hypothetical protein
MDPVDNILTDYFAILQIFDAKQEVELPLKPGSVTMR